MKAARGEFIAFLDSDDEWREDKLAAQVALFRSRHARVGLCYTGVQTIAAHDEHTIQTPHWRGYLYPAMLRRNLIHGGASVMIRRSVVDTVGYFDESLPAIEDYEYWLRISQFFLIDFVEDPLLIYYDNNEQQSEREPTRLSRNFVANQTARSMLHTRYRHDMRAAGVEHHFLISSIRRELNAGDPSSRAFELAQQAILAKPGAVEPYAWAAIAAAPRASREMLRRAARALAPTYLHQMRRT